MLFDFILPAWQYVSTTWGDVSVFLFMGLVIAGLVILALYNDKQKTNSRRLDDLEHEIAECHVERDDLWKKVKNLEADVGRKDSIIKDLKRDIDRLQTNTEHLQRLLNDLLEKMVDDRVEQTRKCDKGNGSCQN